MSYAIFCMLQASRIASLGASAFSFSISLYRHVSPSVGWLLARAIAARDVFQVPVMFTPHRTLSDLSVVRMSLNTKNVAEMSKVGQRAPPARLSGWCAAIPTSVRRT